MKLDAGMFKKSNTKNSFGIEEKRQIYEALRTKTYVKCWKTYFHVKKAYSLNGIILAYIFSEWYKFRMKKKSDSLEQVHTKLVSFKNRLWKSRRRRCPVQACSSRAKREDFRNKIANKKRQEMLINVRWDEINGPIKHDNQGHAICQEIHSRLIKNEVHNLF